MSNMKSRVTMCLTRLKVMKHFGKAVLTTHEILSGVVVNDDETFQGPHFAWVLKSKGGSVTREERSRIAFIMRLYYLFQNN